MTTVNDTLPHKIATLLFAVLYVLTILGVLTGIRPLLLCAAGLSVPYLAMVWSGTVWRTRIIAFVLILTGWYLAGSTSVLVEGAVKNLSFIVLIGGAMVLRRPASESPDMRLIGRWVDSQPPGNRFGVVAGVSHVFGAVLNQAAIVLVSGFLSGSADEQVRRRRMVTILRGFMGSIFWSPMFIATAIALSFVPGTTWIDVAPYGFCGAAAVSLCAWVADRLGRGGGTRGPAPEGPPRAVVLGAMARVGALFVGLSATVILAFEWLGIPIPIAIGLIAPPVALVWRQVSAEADGITDMVQAARTIPPSLGNEVLLFLGANIFGFGVAQALDAETVSLLLGYLPSGPVPQIVVLLLFGVLISAAGLHPVVFMILVGQGFTAERLGMDPALMAALLIAVWSLGVMVSPVAATTLQVSRLTGVSSFRIGWVWNGAFGVASTAVIAALISLYLTFVS